MNKKTHQVILTGSIWRVIEIATRKTVAFCINYEEAKNLAENPQQLESRNKALRGEHECFIF